MLKKNRKLLFISIVVLLIILLIIIVISRKPKRKYSDFNKYKIVDNVQELPGTYVRDTGNLSFSHCLEDICITNVSIHYIDNNGRVEYTITNNSKKKKVGYMKMVFGNSNLIISYSLKRGKSVKGYIQYNNIDLSNVYDYKLSNLTKKEMSNIKKYK